MRNLDGVDARNVRVDAAYDVERAGDRDARALVAAAARHVGQRRVVRVGRDIVRGGGREGARTARRAGSARDIDLNQFNPTNPTFKSKIESKSKREPNRATRSARGRAGGGVTSVCISSSHRTLRTARARDAN